MSRGGSNKAGPPRLQQRARRPVELEEDHHLRAPGAERGGGVVRPALQSGHHTRVGLHHGVAG